MEIAVKFDLARKTELSALKTIEPKMFNAELTDHDTIKIVISDLRGQFVIEKTLTKMEAQILRRRG